MGGHQRGLATLQRTDAVPLQPSRAQCLDLGHAFLDVVLAKGVLAGIGRSGHRLGVEELGDRQQADGFHGTLCTRRSLGDSVLHVLQIQGNRGTGKHRKYIWMWQLATMEAARGPRPKGDTAANPLRAWAARVRHRCMMKRRRPEPGLRAGQAPPAARVPQGGTGGRLCPAFFFDQGFPWILPNFSHSASKTRHPTCTSRQGCPP